MKKKSKILPKILVKKSAVKIAKKSVKKISNKEEIVLKNYPEILKKISAQIKESEKQIIKSVTRHRVVLAWQIGQLVDQHLLQNKQTGYKNLLFKQLERDVKIAAKVLYKMHNFYQTYPKLPQDNEHLNWSHYRALSEIKNEKQRKNLENLALENDWNVRDLERKAKDKLNIKKANEESSETKNNEKIGNTKFLDAKTKPVKKVKKIVPQRGKLFSYPLIKIAESGKNYIDLGFNIFREVEEILPKDAQEALAIDVKKITVAADEILRKQAKQSEGPSLRSTNFKNRKSYSLKKSIFHPRKFNTYKAYLERVVDGDTIHATIDLGFKIFHKEILRLRAINAAEIESKEGKKSAAGLKKILQEVPYLIIKTTDVDNHGRYVADIFLPDVTSDTGLKKASEKSKSFDAQKTADEGIYLNQLLLDKGLAEVF